MKIAYSVLAMAAAALPPHLQGRYREGWEADLLGAEGLEYGAPRFCGVQS